MPRFLSSVMAGCALLTASTLSWAVAVGQVSAYSAPGQPVRVDIELTETEGVQPRDVLMRIADEPDHEAQGLVRPAWADGSYIEVRESPSGSLVGRLVAGRGAGSQLDFVVQIRQNGRLQLHTVSATAGSGSPLLSQPAAPARPAPVRAAAPAPAPAPQPAEPPAPAVEPTPAPAAEVMDAAPAEAGAAADAAMPEDASLEASLDEMALAEPALDETVADDSMTMDVSAAPDLMAADEVSEGSRLKPHEYFNRVLILFFVLAFALWGLIRKLIQKLR